MRLPRPITLARRAHWRPARGLHRGRIPASLRPWLLADGSLTAQVSALCPAEFHVQVLRQSRSLPYADEARALGAKACRPPALIREVALSCGDLQLVLARTVVPASSLRGPCRQLAGLGRRPLGTVLFADRSTRRGALHVTSLRMPGAGVTDRRDRGQTIWGRRALFHFHGAPLLVSEFFLPALTRLARQREQEQCGQPATHAGE